MSVCVTLEFQSTLGGAGGIGTKETIDRLSSFGSFGVLDYKKF